MLIAMLAVWAREGEPVYSEEKDGQTVAYAGSLSFCDAVAHAITDTSPILVPRA